MSHDERVAVFIDGSNFYHYLKSKEVGFRFNTGAWFNYKAFVGFLVRVRTLVSMHYYTGIFRNVDKTERSALLVRGQQKFLAKLENDGFKIKRGRIIYDAGKPREKGTDVAIALDLAMGALKDAYDTAVLVSSDTDLVPALHIVSSYKKKIEYVGFSHRPSFGIQKNVHYSTLLGSEEIKKFTVI